MKGIEMKKNREPDLCYKITVTRGRHEVLERHFAVVPNKIQSKTYYKMRFKKTLKDYLGFRGDNWHKVSLHVMWNMSIEFYERHIYFKIEEISHEELQKEYRKDGHWGMLFNIQNEGDK